MGARFFLILLIVAMFSGCSEFNPFRFSDGGSADMHPADELAAQEARESRAEDRQIDFQNKILGQTF